MKTRDANQRKRLLRRIVETEMMHLHFLLAALLVGGSHSAKRSIFTEVDPLGQKSLQSYPTGNCTAPDRLFAAYKTISVGVGDTILALNISSKTGKSKPGIDEFCSGIAKNERQKCLHLLSNRVQNALLLMYIDHVNHLSEYLQSAGFDLRFAEGGSLYYLELMKLKMKLATSTNARIIVECGFNLGHSALLWLFANPEASVISFDLGEHGYVFPAAEYLRSHFPGRFQLIVGNSLETLPLYADKRPNVFGNVDLFFVDGGHEQTVAQSDLFWAAAYLNKDNRNARIVVDDLQMGSVQHAWKRLVRSGLLHVVEEVQDEASGCVKSDSDFSFVTARRDLECKRKQGYVVPNSEPVLFDMKDVVVGVAAMLTRPQVT